MSDTVEKILGIVEQESHDGPGVAHRSFPDCVV